MHHGIVWAPMHILLAVIVNGSSLHTTKDPSVSLMAAPSPIRISAVIVPGALFSCPKRFSYYKQSAGLDGGSDCPMSRFFWMGRLRWKMRRERRRKLGGSSAGSTTGAAAHLTHVLFGNTF